jgi:hypothetical protein
MRWLAAFALSATLASARAGASTGGPELAEPLGWDPIAQRVYFGMVDASESSMPEGLVYFDLHSATPGRLVRVPWSRALPAQNSTRLARWARVVNRLRPLRQRAAGSSIVCEAVAVDTIQVFGGPRTRFRVRLVSLSAPCSGAITVTTYGRPEVRLQALYSIPRRNESVGLLSFGKLDNEEDYEAQVPVLLMPPGCDSVSVEWKPWQ